MSIMDYFRGKPAEQPAAPAAQMPGQPAPVQAPNPGQQNQPQPAGEDGPSANPLDSFKNLWEPPKEGEATVPNFDPSAMFSVDPAKIQQVVGQMDFTKTITPETMKAVAEGGDGAMQAFAQAMNNVAQQAFAQSMIGASELVKTAMGKANDSLDARLKEGIRKQQVSSSIREANPALNHPAAQPIVAALEAQFTQKYPTATPQDITKMATDYLSKFANVANPSQPDQSNARKSPDDVDWEAFFS